MFNIKIIPGLTHLARSTRIATIPISNISTFIQLYIFTSFQELYKLEYRSLLKYAWVLRCYHVPHPSSHARNQPISPGVCGVFRSMWATRAYRCGARACPRTKYVFPLVPNQHTWSGGSAGVQPRRHPCVHNSKHIVVCARVLCVRSYRFSTPARGAPPVWFRSSRQQLRQDDCRRRRSYSRSPAVGAHGREHHISASTITTIKNTQFFILNS